MGKLDGLEIYKKLKDFAKDETLQKVMTVVFIMAGIIWQIFQDEERLEFVIITGTILVMVAALSTIKQIWIKQLQINMLKSNMMMQSVNYKMNFSNNISQSVLLQAENYLANENPDPMAIQHYRLILSDITNKSPDVIKLLKYDYDYFITEWVNKDKITTDIDSFTKHSIIKDLTAKHEPTISKQVDDAIEGLDDFNKPTEES